MEPPKLGAEYSILVPQVNDDGMDEGGISVPEIAVPLGTFTGWNHELPEFRNLDYLGGLVGSFAPFARTADERKASGDRRLSMVERYSIREGYLEKVRSAAQSLTSRRLLRAEDIPAIVAENGSRWDCLAGSDK